MSGVDVTLSGLVMVAAGRDTAAVAGWDGTTPPMDGAAVRVLVVPGAVALTASACVARLFEPGVAGRAAVEVVIDLPGVDPEAEVEDVPERAPAFLLLDGGGAGAFLRETAPRIGLPDGLARRLAEGVAGWPEDGLFVLALDRGRSPHARRLAVVLDAMDSLTGGTSTPLAGAPRTQVTSRGASPVDDPEVLAALRALVLVVRASLTLPGTLRHLTAEGVEA